MAVKYVQEWQYKCDGAYCWAGRVDVTAEGVTQPAADPPLPADWSRVRSTDLDGERHLCPSCRESFANVFRDVHVVLEEGYTDARRSDAAPPDGADPSKYPPF